MLFSVKKDFFLRLFKIASFVAIEKKSGISVVGSHVLLSVKHKSISLAATDLDVELIVEESLDSIDVPGSAVVPFRKISEICRAMTEDVVLNISTGLTPSVKLNIESNQGFFSINYLQPDVFPLLGSKMFNIDFSVKIKFLQDLISKVAFAMGDDDGRHFLNGVFLHFSKEEIVSVAADGHRLMVWEAPKDVYNGVVVDLKKSVKILIPRKSVFDILKVIAEVPGEFFAKLSVGDHHFRIVINNITYTSKLLTVVFPPFKKLIPANVHNVLTINREQLKSCFLRAVALLGDKSQGVKLSFSASGLQITAKNEQDDLVQESLAAHYVGNDLDVCFNIKYLLDFLSNVNTEVVLFKVENANSGALIHEASLQSSYVLMPMQI